MKKIFLLLIKYLPVIQMAGFLFNNTMYCYYDAYELSYILDFILGNTIINTILLYIISYIFKFCNWYRLIVTANFINLLVAFYDANWRLPRRGYDSSLYLLYSCYNFYINCCLYTY